MKTDGDQNEPGREEELQALYERTMLTAELLQAGECLSRVEARLVMVIGMIPGPPGNGRVAIHTPGDAPLGVVHEALQRIVADMGRELAARKAAGNN